MVYPSLAELIALHLNAMAVKTIDYLPADDSLAMSCTTGTKIFHDKFSSFQILKYTNTNSTQQFLSSCVIDCRVFQSF